MSYLGEFSIVAEGSTESSNNLWIAIVGAIALVLSVTVPAILGKGKKGLPTSNTVATANDEPDYTDVPGTLKRMSITIGQQAETIAWQTGQLQKQEKHIEVLIEDAKSKTERIEHLEEVSESWEQQTAAWKARAEQMEALFINDPNPPPRVPPPWTPPRAMP